MRAGTTVAGRARNIKHGFRFFREQAEAVGDRTFFARWYSQAIRSQLDRIRTVARLLTNQLDRILPWCSSGIPNG